MSKNYVKGSAKKIDFNNGGSIMNVSINVEDLKRLPQNKGYVKLTIAERREKDQWGNTHYIYENDYKPQEKKEEENTDTLPF